jgi:hypothetical protein
MHCKCEKFVNAALFPMLYKLRHVNGVLYITIINTMYVRKYHNVIYELHFMIFTCNMTNVMRNIYDTQQHYKAGRTR